MGGVRLTTGSPVTSDGGGSSHNNNNSHSNSSSGNRTSSGSGSNTAVDASGGARNQGRPSGHQGGGSIRLAPPANLLPGQAKFAAATVRARQKPRHPEVANSRAMLEDAVDALIKSNGRGVRAGVPLPAGAGAHRQPSLPARLQGLPHGGNAGFPMAAHDQVAGGPSGAPPGSSAQALFNAMQAIKPDPEEAGLLPAHKLHRELTCKLQSRIWGLRGGLYAQQAVPRDFLHSFDFDVRELINSVGRMSEAVDELGTHLKKASSGGDQGRIRALESDVADARERAQNAERVLAGLAGRADEDLRAIQFLKEQLRQNEMARTILQEQVNGKRSLWMNVHNDHNERPSTRDSQDRAPTPSTGQTSSTFAPLADNRPSHLRIPSSTATGNQSSGPRPYHLSLPSTATGNQSSGPRPYHLSLPSTTTGNQSASNRSVSETVAGSRGSPQNAPHPSQFVPRQVHASASFHPGAPYPGAHNHGRGPSDSHPAFQLSSHHQPTAAAHQAHYQQQMRQASNTAHSSMVANPNRPPVYNPPVRPAITITGPSPNNRGSAPAPASRRTPRAQTIAETGSPKEKERKRPTPTSTTAVATTATRVPRTLLRTNSAGDDAECLKWAEDFQTLFAHVYGFCVSYFHELPRIGGVMGPGPLDWKGHVTSQANAEVWEMICRSAWGVGESYPGEHAGRLLTACDSRPYLMQRLVLQYVMAFVFGEGGWKEYADEIGGEVAKVDQRLRVLDPSRSTERQELLDRRTTLLTSLASGTESGPYKNFKLTQHHQYLKTLVAPFISKLIPKPTNTSYPPKPPSKTSVSNDAFYDLFTITAGAWDLSTRLHSIVPSSPSRRLSLQYSWAEHGTRFAADSHEPLDCGVDRRTLQQEHCRITLCATPAVTVRVVRGEGEGGKGKVVDVDVRNILKAGVLVMRY